MQIAQYGTSASLTNGTSGYVCCDRWIAVNSTGSTATVAQSSTTSYGGIYSLGISASTILGSGNVQFIQRIEAQNIADLAGQTVTLSFYAAATAAGGTLAANITISYPSVLDNWPSSIITTPITLSFAITSSPTRFTKTFTLPSQCTNGAQISITASNTGSSASSFSMNVGSVQLEAGSVATPFEQQSIGQILALCQRYYNTSSFGFGGATSGVGTGVYYRQQFPVTMRVTPTITIPTSSATFVTSTTLQPVDVNTVQIYGITTTSSGGWSFYGVFTAFAELW